MWARHHRLLGGMALLLVVAVVIVFWALTRHESRRLDDGSEFSVRRVAYGKRDQWAAGPLLNRLIVRVVPQKVRPLKYRTRAWTMESTNEVLFLWMEWKFRSNVNATNMSASSLLAGVVDPGSGLEEAPIPIQFWIPSSSNTVVLGYQVPNFPRHSSRVLLRFYDKKAGPSLPPVAEFTIRNPARSSDLITPPEPLPQTRSNGVRAFTLTSLVTGLQDRSPSAPSPPFPPLTWTAFAFETSGPDQTGSPWMVRSVQCSDRAGNVILEQRARMWPGFEDKASVPLSGRGAMIAGALWPGDVWRLRVRFEPSGIPIEDRVTFLRLPIPDTGQTNTLSDSRQVHGSTVRLFFISTSPMTETHRLLRTRKLVTVVSNFTPSVYTDELQLVDATDDLGTNAYRLGSFPNRMGDFRMLVLKEARSVDVTLGVKRLREVEFAAPATVLLTNFPSRLP